MLERVIWFVVSLVVLVLAFFFLAVALVVGAVLAVVLLARIWWIHRRMSKAQQDQVITTEYTVIEREPLPSPTPPDETSLRHSREGGSPGKEPDP